MLLGLLRLTELGLLKEDNLDFVMINFQEQILQLDQEEKNIILTGPYFRIMPNLVLLEDILIQMIFK